MSSDHTSHTFCYFVVLLKRYYIFLFVVGWSFFSSFHPLLQCFMAQLRSIRRCRNGIRVRWQVCIKVYSLSLSVATLSAVIFECTTIWVSSDHNSHTFCYSCLCPFDTVPFLLLFVVGLVFLFFVAPSFAVFYDVKKFNQDVSKWNTGAVTDMYGSKCTLSPSLCGHAFHCCVFWI